MFRTFQTSKLLPSIVGRYGYTFNQAQGIQQLKKACLSSKSSKIENQPVEGKLQDGQNQPKSANQPQMSVAQENMQQGIVVQVLAAGDFFAYLSFASIGSSMHGEGFDLLHNLEIAAPFLISWYVACYFLGGYGPKAQNGRVGPAALTTLKCWAASYPVGILIRSALKGYLMPLGFMIPTAATTLLMSLAWRCTYALIVPTQDEQ